MISFLKASSGLKITPVRNKCVNQYFVKRSMGTWSKLMPKIRGQWLKNCNCVLKAFSEGWGIYISSYFPFIARLSSVGDKIQCFNSSDLPKITKICLSDDVSKATVKSRRQKFYHLKQKRLEEHIAFFGVRIWTWSGEVTEALMTLNQRKPVGRGMQSLKLM